MKKLAFIGAGSMAEAMISGIVESKLLKGEQIWVTNRSNQEKLDNLHEKYGINGSYDYKELLDGADAVILAMKPKEAATGISQIKSYLTENTMLISVLAGVSIDNIELLAEKKLPVVRAMPNTSATVGKSATGLAINTHVTARQKDIVQTIFETVGLTAFVEESKIDAITGLSGSGPAYIYYLIEAMEKGAEEIGLEKEIAKNLIVQTLLGAAEMVATSSKPAQQLRKEVTSPGGTTEAGLRVLASYDVQNAFINCIKEATAQSKRLGIALSDELYPVK
ncbi:pyrroline-5-carboxylate reductase [Bacillus sp. DNRA2]|uniref:pyrroline-5-carboxylate reductase n=1 Tax=Bacillus sp. DNRA2 TaxID=2723053 RepID=UPI00145C9E18|nr:pyrroline-5-carboxylate reductase [Bacillus sp. DNRA2]NMD70230.1 pyrroline-5-carboxylate reductase [Bacillus sp. DNRA2]